MSAGFIFNIQRYSLQDGPGIRTTVFLKGCPLRCVWCHNPEGIFPATEVATFETRCQACGECAEACPKALPHTSSDHGDLCDLCGACVEACPTGARHLVGRTITVADTLREILKDRVFYDDSRGGVTFSGGEPMAQFEFLRDILEQCRRHGIHATVDTTGFCLRDDLLAVAQLTDLFLYDIKVLDEARHLKYIGIPNGLILDNLRALSQAHRNIWIRMPIVPGLNDDQETIAATARFVQRLPGVTLVNLLPYHQTGIMKFKRLGKLCQLEGASSPSIADMEKLSQIFTSHGLTVRIGG